MDLLPSRAEIGQKAKELQSGAKQQFDAMKDRVNEMRGNQPEAPAAPAAPPAAPPAQPAPQQ